MSSKENKKSNGEKKAIRMAKAEDVAKQLKLATALSNVVNPPAPDPNNYDTDPNEDLDDVEEEEDQKSEDSSNLSSVPASVEDGDVSEEARVAADLKRRQDSEELSAARKVQRTRKD
jgi:hypothetical protein